MVWRLNAHVKALLQEIAEIKELLSIRTVHNHTIAHNRESNWGASPRNSVCTIE
jgi:hypothetical protein